MTIYFAAGRRRMKIGYTAGPVERRLKSISAHLSEPLKLIATMDGDTALERAIHEELQVFHKKGEWFRDCAELRERIVKIRANPPQPKPAPDAKALPALQAKTPEQYGQMLEGLAAILWPDEPVREMAAFSEATEEDCRAWFRGDALPPRLVQHAFAARIVQLALS